MGLLELKNAFSSGGVLGAADVSGVLTGTHLFVLFSAPFDAGLNVTPHTASRRSLLPAVRSSISRRRLARSSTRLVM